MGTHTDAEDEHGRPRGEPACCPSPTPAIQSHELGDITAGADNWFEGEGGVPPEEYDEFFDRVELVPRSTIWEIIERWKSGLIDSNQALGQLEVQEMLDPDALMMGWACYQTAKALREGTDCPPPSPPRIPPAAPGGALRPYSSVPEDVLEILATARVA